MRTHLIGNLGSDFKTWGLYFASRCISINKSKSEFHGIPSLPFLWKIRKKICKNVLVNSVFFFGNNEDACETLVFENRFSNLFFVVPRKTERKEIQGQISRCQKPFLDSAYYWKSEIRI